MHQVERPEYCRAEAVYGLMEHHLAVRSVLEGTTQAGVYLDNLDRPRAALALVGQRFYLAGEAGDRRFNEALGQLLHETIFPQGLKSGEEMFVLYYAPESWAEPLGQILGERHPIDAPRRYYATRELTSHSRKQDWRAKLPEGFELQVVDRSLLAKTQLKNHERLVEEVCSERASVEDFLGKSFGVCVVQGDELVGWCLSEYNTGQRCEVGIEMMEPYRRRGLGTAAAAALIEKAVLKGIRHVGWHCYASNAGSVGTALKAGLHKKCDYPVFLCWYDDADQLAVHGNIAFRAGKHREALVWFERAFDRGGAKDWAYWGGACAAALLGQEWDALRYLSEAVDRGFADTGRLVRSEHLASLHARAEWGDLVRRVREAERGPAGDSTRQAS
jgi:hypothetical protein